MNILTVERLKELLSYDPDTGVFTWRVYRSRTAKAGWVAGIEADDGYVMIKIDGRSYLAHRLAWLYMTGEWPEDQVDHRDRCRSNNRWINLRPADNGLNQHNARLQSNNTSGCKGVSRDRNRWQANINVRGKRIYLGSFEAKDEAIAARLKAVATYCEEFGGIQ